MRVRFLTLLIFFLLSYSMLIARLFYWQIIKGESLSVQARGQYKGVSEIKASRGEILAADGSALVASVGAWLLYANIQDLDKNPSVIAEKLAPILVGEDDKSKTSGEKLRLENLLSKSSLVWVPLRHKLSTNVKKEIEALKIKGLGFQEEEQRFYPEASSAAHLLGFVGKDEKGSDKGYFGLEGYYNLALSGKPGFLSRDEDLRGVPILFGKGSKEIDPVEGVGLDTNINKGFQLDLEKKLKEGIEKYGAASGTAIIMNPKSGAIMAMASYPSYDPEKYNEFNDVLFSNPAISFTFEPGSVFKVIIMASALDAGVVRPETKCPICDGPFKIDKYSIGTWNDVYHPDSSMTDVIVNSDNVGMAYVGTQLGADKLYEYLKRFGIGNLTGIDLQGEATANLREKGSWGTIDVATASFGQGVAVTPIQMVRAVGAIANKGIIVTPQVVDKLSSNNWSDDIKPVIGERVISEKAASEITAMMVEAAKRGESKWTNLPGFKVAGKTGTAQIPIQGHYDEDKTIASFIGFAPYNDPKFIMFVTLQEPQSSPWASETAAPLWYSVAKDLFNFYGISPESQ